MTDQNTDVAVIGGGAAGMAAAYAAAVKGASVLLLEKNEKLGKKVYITGKGRCNLTNASEIRSYMDHIVSNPRFLYSALNAFGPDEVMDQIEKLGTPLKTERGNRVFPVSDHASDITKAWNTGLQQSGVITRLHSEVHELLIQEHKAAGVVLKDGSRIDAKTVIVATGGLSYPSTGSTGDGYRFALACGHSIIPCRPSLVPLLVREKYVGELEGLSLRNITLTIPFGKKKRFTRFGELLFTRDGISGPLGLTASAYLGKELENRELTGTIDLKPALTEEQTDGRLLREFSDNPNKSVKNVLRKLLPASLCPVLCSLLSFDAEKAVNAVTREERYEILHLIKAFPFTFTGTRGFNEAVITQGGINIKEIDPKTMESRLCRNLFFAGEILDLDALTGGYNLQIAWSTGYCAGAAAAESALTTYQDILQEDTV
ncbi:MAG: NAD(P)/FAD-dependent oxidoreductase [Eubacterium sp.]|nr:NAD(P)/FAD-dependent oxidoreductase [Eubacterium sp.]